LIYQLRRKISAVNTNIRLPMTDVGQPGEPAFDQGWGGRRAREFAMIAAMLGMYCRAHHGERDAALCAKCVELHDYARRRLERCVFGDAKPTCANCTVHCYKPSMRERVRHVMRWAGPRMVWRHPVMAVRHMFDGRLPAPVLQRSR
jgi:YbgA-like uncharacterized protein